MTIQRMDHLGIVVDDLDAAVSFFTDLGLVEQGRATVEGAWVGKVIGLEDVRSDIAYLQAPDGHGAIEISAFHSPPSQEGGAAAPANARGIRHVSFLVDDLDAAVGGLKARGTELVGEVLQYEEIYRLCYVRGPEGVIVELAELGS